MEKRHNYVRKVAETAVQMFISNDKPNISGMILAGSADFKTELSQSDMFDPRLQVRHSVVLSHIFTPYPKPRTASLLLDRRSINLSGPRGHFHYKNFLSASKWGITCHTCSIIPKSLYCGLGLIPISSKGILGWWSRYGMWYLISKLSKSFYIESDLLFLVHLWGRLTSD